MSDPRLPLPTASAMEAQHLAGALDSIAADLRRAADTFEGRAATVRAGGSQTQSGIPYTWVWSEALHDLVTMLANMSLPGTTRYAGRADAYRAQDSEADQHP